MKNLLKSLSALFTVLCFALTSSVSVKAQCSDGYVPDPSFVSNSACTNGSYTGSLSNNGFIPNGYYGYDGISYTYCGSGGCYVSCDNPCMVEPEPSISCGETIPGSTTTSSNNYGGSSPEDIYAFEVLTSSSVTFSTCNSNYDTWLRIYDSNMQEIESCDDCGDCGVQTVLENIALSPGNYYILIEGYSDYSGDYNLEMTCVDNNAGCTSSWADNYLSLIHI